MNASDILLRLSTLEDYLRASGDTFAADEVYALAVDIASDSASKQVYQELSFS